MDAPGLSRLVGRPIPQETTGLVFPYHGCDSFTRVKLFPPLVDADGTVRRYLQRKGIGCRLYIPSTVAPLLADVTKPLAFVEGEKKTLAVCQAGWLAVGIGGIWNFATDGALISDIKAIPLKGRIIRIIPDGETWEREDLLPAVFRFGRLLEAEGATVFIVKLPVLGGEKTGADDFILTKGRRAFRRLVKKAVTLAHPAFKALREQEKQRARALARAANKAEAERVLTEAEVADLARQAARILEAPDPLAVVDAAIRSQGYGGDTRHACITYLAATSRLLAMRAGSMPGHLLLLGAPSSGKSFTLKVVLRLLPPDAFYEIEAGSPRVLIYDATNTRHRAIIFGEADSLPAGEDNPAASAIRNLLQEHRLRYTVVERDPESGEFCTRDVVKDGPSVLITTAVCRLGAQMNSRVFSLEARDDPDQIRHALAAQAAMELSGAPEPDPALIAFQAFLQARAPWEVVVPFARELADAMGKGAAAPRLQRDFQRLLSLVKAVAILRHRHRHRDEKGRLVATLEDYATVCALVADMYEATTGVSQATRQAVEAVQALRETNRGVSVTDVSKHLKISKMAASRRVQTAIKGGWLVNAESRKGHAAILELGEPLPEETGLPTLEAGGGCNTVTPLIDEIRPTDAASLEVIVV